MSPECIDCLEEGVARWRPVEGVRVKRCATHRRAKKVAAKQKTRAGHVERTYGITAEEWRKLYEFQGSLCAVCGPVTGNRGASKALSTDHDHKCCAGPTSCGECVRGLLCSTCNVILGRWRDSPEVALSLLSYLLDPPMKQLRAGEEMYVRRMQG